MASELQVNTIQPASGQALTIKDEGGTASITVATNGEATFAENIKISANKGINFSAYATSGNPSSNLLEDYEEGTWTPALETGGDSITEGRYGNATGFTNVTGNYTKIGRYVNCHAEFYVAGGSFGGNLVGDDNFSVTYASLPFAPANDFMFKEMRGTITVYVSLGSGTNASGTIIPLSGLNVFVCQITAVSNTLSVSTTSPHAINIDYYV